MRKKGEWVAATLALSVAVGVVGIVFLTAVVEANSPTAKRETSSAIGNYAPPEICNATIPVATATRYGSSKTMTDIDPSALTDTTDYIFADLDYPLLEKHGGMDFNRDGDIEDIINPFVEQDGGLFFVTDTDMADAAKQTALDAAYDPEQQILVLLDDIRHPPEAIKWEHIRRTDPDIPNTFRWHQWSVAVNQGKTCWTITDGIPTDSYFSADCRFLGRHAATLNRLTDGTTPYSAPATAATSLTTGNVGDGGVVGSLVFPSGTTSLSEREHRTDFNRDGDIDDTIGSTSTIALLDSTASATRTAIADLGLNMIAIPAGRWGHLNINTTSQTTISFQNNNIGLFTNLPDRCWGLREIIP